MHPQPRPTSRPRTPVPIRSVLLVAAAVAAPGLTSPIGAATDYLWIGPDGGLWSTAANWSPLDGAPPDRATDSATFSAPVLATLTGRRSVGTLAVDAPATLLLASDSRLDVHGESVVCAGLVRIANHGQLSFIAGAGQPVDRVIVGAGVIRLEGERASIEADPALSLGTDPNLAISGQGKFVASMRFGGPIVADVPGGELVLDGAVNHADAALIARAGGILVLNTTTLTLGPDASITAEPGGVVLLDGSSITGGAIIGLGGVISTDANVTLDGVTIMGDLGVPAASSLTVVSPILGQQGGTITLGGQGPVAGISEFICFDPLTLSGRGSLILAPATTPEGLPISARLSIGPTAVLTLADGYTLAGAGEIIGALRVGAPGTAPATIDLGAAGAPGRLVVDGPLEVTSTGSIRFTIFAAGASDSILASGPTTIAGDLLLEFASGVAPEPADQFLIIEGAAVQAADAQLVVPPMPGLRVARLEPRADGLWLAIALCAADTNADGLLDADDLGDFINGYFGNVSTPGSYPAADFNADGAVDADDLGDYINAYFGGC